MQELTKEQVAAFPLLVDACKAVMNSNVTEGTMVDLAKVALAAAEPKVPTLEEAADQVIRTVQTAHEDGRSAEESWELFLSSSGICPLVVALAREREAQAAAERGMEAMGLEKVKAEPAPEPVEDFGEPHSLDASGHLVTTRYGSGVALDQRCFERRNACTNALAGCDPDRLGEVIAKAQEVVDLCFRHDFETPEQAHSVFVLKNVLARFKPETPNAPTS